MRIYNKIMRLVWLFIAVALTLLISYLCLTQGLNKWASYYIFVIAAFGMFFFKSYMIKRVERHLEYLEQQKQNTKTTPKSS
jgi:hypothetical protein